MGASGNTSKLPRFAVCAKVSIPAQGFARRWRRALEVIAQIEVSVFEPDARHGVAPGKHHDGASQR